MSYDIKGVLKLYEGKSMDGLLTVEGKILNDSEAGQFLNDCIKKGYECLPMGNSDDCPNFDYYSGGYPGHPVTKDKK